MMIRKNGENINERASINLGASITRFKVYVGMCKKNKETGIYKSEFSKMS
jgi:hypothetical protein